MLSVTFADLRFRYRQFLIAVVGAGMVLAMGVLLAGLVSGFAWEINQVVDAQHADYWVLSHKAEGQLTAASTFPETTVAAIEHEPSVTQAAGIAVLPQVPLILNGKTTLVNLIGVPTTGFGAPGDVTGSGLSDRNDAIIDTKVHGQIGDVLTAGSTSLHVVGKVHGRTLLGGLPVVYVPLATAQQFGFGGLPLVTAVTVQGTPTSAPADLDVLTTQRVEDKTLARMSSAIATIKNTRGLMWLVATIIIAALIYVSALQRVRDFAVLKALGASSGALFGSLCLQAIVVTLFAAVFAAVACNFMTGLFAQPIAIPVSAFVTLPLVAVGVGMLASLVALRTATGADPVSAFGA
ncbi:MAG TPA: ABC transporter permease [Mycobacteriales bacterium]|nr:ABC transporter permease [Mycobacteriales bacterium]